MIKGEVRSHSPEKLDAYTKEFENVFTETAENWPVLNTGKKPSAALTIEFDYPVMKLSADDDVIKTINTAGKKLGKELTSVIAGGGSDANIYNNMGLSTAILATGMDKVHTTDECLDLNDIVTLTELLYAMADRMMSEPNPIFLNLLLNLLATYY